MTVYVDQITTYSPTIIQGQARMWGNQWSHLWTNGDIEELHIFAEAIGLKREWFQPHHIFDHYDIVPSRRDRALRAGAVFITTREFLRRER